MTSPLGYTCIRPRVTPQFFVAPILHKTGSRVVIAHPEGGEKAVRQRDTYGTFAEEPLAERAAYRLTRLACQRRKDEIAARQQLTATENETERLLRSTVEAAAKGEM